MATKHLRTVLTLVLAFGIIGLSGCGGGGGGASGTGATGGTTGGTTTGTPTVTVTLLDAAGASTTGLNYGTPLTAQALVKNAAGSPASNAVVSFSTAASLATLSPSSGTALTNSSGIASVQMSSAGIDAAGAGLLTANATVSSIAATGTAPFSVGAAAVSMTSLNIGGTGSSSANLSAFGTTSISTTVTINSVAPTLPVQVNFTSGCAAIGKATLPASVQAVNGVATATYQDNGCAAADTVTASVANTTVSRTGTITVAGPQAANIQFNALSPADGRIVLKGTGGVGYTEVAAVTFKIVDTGGNGVPNQNVTFDLTTRVGGILLDNTSAAVTKQTDSAGLVTVNVQSGTVPTPVWVTAATTVPGVGTVSSQSNMLTISTGKPSQDFFSLSIGTHNIEGWRYDGSTTSVNVIASDRLGNPVPDGTAINFIAEGAQVDPTCTTTGGGCSVTFRSADYRPGTAPTTNPDSEPSSYGVTEGRVTVLAYALGEMSFIDANNNNLFDTGESIDLLGNAFLDKNESFDDSATAAKWQSGENAIVFDTARASACPYDSNPGGIPQKLKYAPSVSATCGSAPTTSTWSTAGVAHVRRVGIITLSSWVVGAVTPASITMSEGVIPPALAPAQKFVTVRVEDENGNPLPAGTAISITNNAVSCSKSGSAVSAVPITVTPGTVPNTSAAGGTYHTIKVGDATTCDAGTVAAGGFSLTFVTPLLNSSSYSITVAP